MDITRLGNQPIVLTVFILVLGILVSSLLVSRFFAGLDSAAELTAQAAEGVERKDVRNARAWAVLHVWHLLNLAWFSTFAWIIRCFSEGWSCWSVPVHYTPWAFRLQPLYWLVAVVHDATCVLERRGSLRAARYAPATWECMNTLLELFLPMSWLVTIVVFVLLHPFDLGILESPSHFWNTLCLTGELLLNPTLMVRRSRVCVLVVYSFVYIVVLWTRRVFGDSETTDWPYFFLKIQNWGATFWYVVLIALHLAVYMLCVCASTGRRRCCPRAILSIVRGSIDEKDEIDEIDEIDAEQLGLSSVC